MSLGPAIVYKLSSDAGVSAIVVDRIYPQYVRENDRLYPMIVYKIDNVDPQMTHDGPNGLESADLTLAAIGMSQVDARLLAEAIQTSINGSRGVWGDLTVQGCFLKDDGINDDVITEPTTEEILAYVKELSFTVWYAK